MLKERVLAPLIAVALVVSLTTVAWSTRSHRRPGPLVSTAIGAALVMCGRLVWTVPALVYIGGAALIAASMWNVCLKRRRRPAPATASAS